MTKEQAKNLKDIFPEWHIGCDNFIQYEDVDTLIEIIVEEYEKKLDSLKEYCMSELEACEYAKDVSKDSVIKIIAQKHIEIYQKMLAKLEGEQ